MAVQARVTKQQLIAKLHDGVAGSGNPKYYNKSILLVNDEIEDDDLYTAYQAMMKLGGFRDTDHGVANIFQSVDAELEESVGDKK